MTQKIFNKKGFTLIELLVVVLIIGILAAIAVPQYQKAVLKSRLHQGVSLVESLYQAQQAYRLAHGDFATDIDDLDISVPKDENCTKTQNSSQSLYICDFGKIGLFDIFSNVQFQDSSYQIAYLHFIKDNDLSSSNLPVFEKGKRYCWARANNETAKSVCQSMGGILAGEVPNGWAYYQLN